MEEEPLAIDNLRADSAKVYGNAGELAVEEPSIEKNRLDVASPDIPR